MISREDFFSGNVLHLVSNIDQAQEHVEGSPERRDILGFDFKDQRIGTFDPALYHRSRVDFVAELGEKRTVDRFRMIGRKPENSFVRHRYAS
jgi:hypothetical protein